MKHWKAALGLGAACAVCCAVPLGGLVSGTVGTLGTFGVVAGTSGLAGLASALTACAGEWADAAAWLALAAGASVLWIVWRRRQAAPAAQCSLEGRIAAPTTAASDQPFASADGRPRHSSPED